eukprot:2930135-Karenia_brevis.AAC.1
MRVRRITKPKYQGQSSGVSIRALSTRQDQSGCTRRWSLQQSDASIQRMVPVSPNGTTARYYWWTLCVGITPCSIDFTAMTSFALERTLTKGKLR